MEEEKNDSKKESSAPKINVWDRLIKLDKKNNQLNSFQGHKYLSQLNIVLLSVFSHQTLGEVHKSQSNFWWPTNETEQNIRSYWNHYNETYFQNISKEDINLIDSIETQLQVPSKGKK